METNVKAWLDALHAQGMTKQVQTAVPMADYTTVRLGGPASLFVEATSSAQIVSILKAVKAEQIPFYVLGKGSNLIVRDGGFDGLVLHVGAKFAEVTDPVPLPDGRFAITAQAGASLQKLSNQATAFGLTGLEFAAGIPGSVGGAVFMNAGAYGGEMKQVVSHVTALDYDGVTHSYTPETLDFGYRHSVFHTEKRIVTSVTVVLTQGDQETIRATVLEFAKRRRDKQPITEPSCGSTFKRPEGYFAGTLIQDAGLKGYRIGGACVSEKHAGFLLNDEKGTASDFLALIAHVQKTVQDKNGVLLTPEPEMIGKEKPKDD